jgi:small subunit ribosomal protein S16
LETENVAVKIRMKRLGRKHRSYFRICATDSRAPRDGRVIEELGSYDPEVPLTDARCKLNNERIQYWLGVGAQPSDRVKVLIKKYGPGGTHLKEHDAAVAQLKAPKSIPDPGAPVFVPKPKKQTEEAPAAPAESSEATPGVEAAPAAE